MPLCIISQNAGGVGSAPIRAMAALRQGADPFCICPARRQFRRRRGQESAAPAFFPRWRSRNRSRILAAAPGGCGGGKPWDDDATRNPLFLFRLSGLFLSQPTPATPAHLTNQASVRSLVCAGRARALSKNLTARAPESPEHPPETREPRDQRLKSRGTTTPPETR